MRHGRYFRHPEGPQDIERLWTEAAATRGQIPAWLAPAGPDSYRRIVTLVPPQGNEAEEARYAEELRQLEAATLVIDDVKGDRLEHAIYVPAPSWDSWAIGMYEGASPFRLGALAAADNPVLTRESVTDVPASFVADPFMIRVQDRWHMFFEVMNWRANKGEIGLATSEDGVRWRYEGIVLAETCHLSYPFVFEWAGGVYMVPESAQTSAVRLYRARRFPFEWELVDVLLSGTSVLDASLLRHDGRWWMFCAVDNGTLSLFHADDPSSGWREHPASPVVRDNRHMARPAGRPLVQNGTPMRLAQDCEGGYGSAVVAVRITMLTTQSYQEEAAGRPVVAPTSIGWNGRGMHHVDALQVGGRWLACVDGRSYAATEISPTPGS